MRKATSIVILIIAIIVYTGVLTPPDPMAQWPLFLFGLLAYAAGVTWRPPQFRTDARRASSGDRQRIATRIAMLTVLAAATVFCSLVVLLPIIAWRLSDTVPVAVHGLIAVAVMSSYGAIAFAAGLLWRVPTVRRTPDDVGHAPVR